MIHIYCGDGKGKSTAAAGLALRCAGYGRKVLFVRFFKNDSSGELKGLRMIPEIELLSPRKSFGFYWNLSEQEKAELKNDFVFWCKFFLYINAESGFRQIS